MNTFNARYLRRSRNEEGRTEIVLELSSVRDEVIIEELQKNALYRLNFSEIKSKKTLQQSHYLWSLLHDISVARNGELATSESDWEVYIEALERAQAKFEYVACLPEAYELLKQQFRATKIMNEFEHNGKTFIQAKVFYGSSKMDVKEMAKLLDTVIMMAQAEGVELREISSSGK